MELAVDDGRDDGSWRPRAACRTADPDLFFPGGADVPTATVRALEICAGCPVREECLAFAVETGQRAGIWGGHTEDERPAIRRRWVASRRAFAS